MAFRLETFGGLALLSPTSSRVHQRQRLALLALLAASERGLSRDQIIAFLWPDKPDESARHSLDQLLYALRRALGSTVFEGGDPLRLNDAVVTSDVGEFAGALGRGALADACTLYRGPFLDGFYLGNGSEFEEWLETTRARLAAQYRSALARLASDASAAGDLTDAVRWWSELAAVDPLSGRVALGLMRALAASGDRAAALQHARVHESIVREQLGTAPDAEITAFVTQLRSAVPHLTPSKREALEVESGDAVVSRADAAGEPVSEPAGVSVGAPAHGGRRATRGRIWVGAFAVLALTLGVYSAMWANGVGPWASLLRRGAIAERERVVLADFRNATSDTTLGHVVTEMLRVDLGESRILTLMAPAYVAQVLQRMGRRADEAFSADLAREAAIREGIKAVVEGEVGAAGGSYVMTARIVEAQDGAILASFRETARDQNELLSAIDALAESIRNKAGESLADIEASPPLEQVTTPSLDALRLYAQSRAVGDDPERMMALLEAAVSIDPQFASAWRALGALGSAERREEAARRAYELSDRLPLRERDLAIAYYLSSPGPQQDQTRAAQVYQNIIDMYPLDTEALNALAFIKRDRNELVEALALFQRAAATPRPDPNSLAAVSTTLYRLRREEESEEALDRLAALYPDHPYVNGLRWVHAVYGRRWRDADSLASHRDQRHQRDGGRYSDLALNRVARGRLNEAEPIMRQRADWSASEAYSTAIERARIQNVWLGDSIAARRALSDVLARYPLAELGVQMRPYLRLAAAYAHLGDTGEMEGYVARYETESPDAAQGHIYRGISAGRVGFLALAKGDLVAAERQFRDARRLQDCAICYQPELGLTLLRAGKHEEAVRELEAFVADRRATGSIDMYYTATYTPLVQEWLGQLREELGRNQEAAAAYETVVEIWKDADHPVLQERVQRARERAAALRGNPRPE